MKKILDILTDVVSTDFSEEKYIVNHTSGSVYTTGVIVSFRGNNEISLQTNASCCGDSICEIAMFKKEGGFITDSDPRIKHVLPTYYSPPIEGEDNDSEEIMYRVYDWEEFATFFRNYITHFVLPDADRTEPNKRERKQIFAELFDF